MLKPSKSSVVSKSYFQRKSDLLHTQTFKTVYRATQVTRDFDPDHQTRNNFKVTTNNAPSKRTPQSSTLKVKDQMITLRSIPNSRPNRGKNGGVTNNDVFKAGRLAQYAHRWSSAPGNLQKIIRGYRIPFIQKPPLLRFSLENIQRFSTQQTPEMSKEIENLLKSGALTKSVEKSGFLSTMFLRKKANGENRPIFNLKTTFKFHCICTWATI